MNRGGISGGRDTGETIKVNIAVRAGFVLETCQWSDETCQWSDLDI
jgi:hypothetical protein